MNYFCKSSKNSQEIVSQFLSMCGEYPHIFLAGPKGVELDLLVREYTSSLPGRVDRVVQMDAYLLNADHLQVALGLPQGRSLPPAIIINAKELKFEEQELICDHIQSFIEPGIVFFYDIGDFDPNLDNEGFSSRFSETIKKSLFILPELKLRKADLASFAMEILEENKILKGNYSKHTLHKEAVELLLSYDWPGNYLELSAVMRYLAFANTPRKITKAVLLDAINLTRTQWVEA